MAFLVKKNMTINYFTELIDEIYKNLSGIAHVHVYKKADIPAEYHFQHNRRIQEILVVPEEHYWVSYNNSNGSSKSLVINHLYCHSLNMNTAVND